MDFIYLLWALKTICVILPAFQVCLKVKESLNKLHSMHKFSTLNILKYRVVITIQDPGNLSKINKKNLTYLAFSICQRKLQCMIGYP